MARLRVARLTILFLIGTIWFIRATGVLHWNCCIRPTTFRNLRGECVQRLAKDRVYSELTAIQFRLRVSSARLWIAVSMKVGLLLGHRSHGLGKEWPSLDPGQQDLLVRTNSIRPVIWSRCLRSLIASVVY